MQKPLPDLVYLVVKTALVVSVAVACISLLTRYVGTPSLSISQTSTQKQSTFDVTGKAEMVAVPDEAKISVGITAQELTVAKAQDKVNQTISNITDALKTLGIDKKDIKTQNYSIYPDMDYQPNALNKITGYNANVNLLVTVKDFDKVNQIIDQATALGANNVGGVSFDLSDAKRKELENQARGEAIKDAQEKGQALAKLAGMRLGKVVNVSENQPANQMYFRETIDAALPMAAGKSAAPTNIEPGSQTYEYKVTVSYETL
jgi:uncharacterized protein YggE